ncbi:TPA: hypothetical protein VAO37_001675 [Streptococcus agalactiae]|nr:hypothetical protein [Streptococcus agalactiae]HEO7770325.1 hypothetical protein [Streptococcus agalactiae]
MEQDRLLLNDIRKGLLELKKYVNRQDDTEKATRIYNDFKNRYQQLNEKDSDDTDKIVSLSLEVEETLDKFKAEGKWYKRLGRFPRKLEEESDDESIIHYVYVFFETIFVFIIQIVQSFVELLPQRKDDDLDG